MILCTLHSALCTLHSALCTLHSAPLISSDIEKEIEEMSASLSVIHTPSAPAAIGPYSQAIAVNGLVYTSGQIAIDPATGNIDAQGIEAQTEQVIQNLSAVLQAAGSDLTQVVKTTCFLQRMSDFAAFNAVYGKYFTGKPARSCVEVSALPKNALVEIEAVAVIGK